MISDYSLCLLPDLVERQLSGFFPFSDEERHIVDESLPPVIELVEICFSAVDNKYFHKKDEVWFSPFHSGQWLIFLYYLSHYISTDKGIRSQYPNGNKALADKIYYLNKIMHSVDIYHEVKLPASFFLEHPVGTVLGRASYKEGFMAYQNCTVGGNKGKYPILGKDFHMMSGSKVLGDSHIGDRVTLAANTYVKDQDIPAGATVFGSSPNLILKFL